MDRMQVWLRTHRAIKRCDSRVETMCAGSTPLLAEIKDRPRRSVRLHCVPENFPRSSRSTLAAVPCELAERNMARHTVARREPLRAALHAASGRGTEGQRALT